MINLQQRKIQVNVNPIELSSSPVAELDRFQKRPSQVPANNSKSLKHHVLNQRALGTAQMNRAGKPDQQHSPVSIVDPDQAMRNLQQLYGHQLAINSQYQQKSENLLSQRHSLPNKQVGFMQAAGPVQQSHVDQRNGGKYIQSQNTWQGYNQGFPKGQTLKKNVSGVSRSQNDPLGRYYSHGSGIKDNRNQEGSQSYRMPDQDIQGHSKQQRRMNHASLGSNLEVAAVQRHKDGQSRKAAQAPGQGPDAAAQVGAPMGITTSHSSRQARERHDQRLDSAKLRHDQQDRQRLSSHQPERYHSSDIRSGGLRIDQSQYDKSHQKQYQKQRNEQPRGPHYVQDQMHSQQFVGQASGQYKQNILHSNGAAGHLNKPPLSQSPRHSRQKTHGHERQQRNVHLLDSRSSQNNKVPAAPQSGQSSSSSNVNGYMCGSQTRSNNLRPHQNQRAALQNSNSQQHDLKGNKDDWGDNFEGMQNDRYVAQNSLNKHHKASHSQRVIKNHHQTHLDKPREAFTARQPADPEICQSEWYKQSDYEVLYQRSSNKKLSQGGFRRDEAFQGAQEPAHQQALRLRGVGTHLARVDDQLQQCDMRRNTEAPLREASAQQSEARKQTHQGNVEKRRAEGGLTSQPNSQLQASHRVLRPKKSARPSTSRTGQKQFGGDMKGGSVYIGNSQEPLGQSQNAQGPAGQSRSGDASVDCIPTKPQRAGNACRTQRGSRQVLEPSEELALRRESTEPTAQLQFRSADMSLEPRPALSNSDQMHEYYSQGNLNDLTFQYSNPMESEDASPPVGNQSQSQANNTSLDSSGNGKKLQLMAKDRQMVSEEKLPMSGDAHLLQQSASSQHVVHTSRGVHMNIEHYQARRRAKMSKYNSLIGNADQHSIGNSASANVLSYHKDGIDKTDLSINTNESTPIGSKFKAAELISEQQRLSQSGGEKSSEAPAALPSTPTAEAKVEQNFTTYSKSKLPFTTDPKASQYQDSVARGLQTNEQDSRMAHEQNRQALWSHRVGVQEWRSGEPGTLYLGEPTSPNAASSGDVKVAFSQGLEDRNIGTLSQSASARRLLSQGQAQSNLKETKGKTRAQSRERGLLARQSGSKHAIVPPQSQRGARDKIIVGKSFEQSAESTAALLQPLQLQQQPHSHGVPGQSNYQKNISMGQQATHPAANKSTERSYDNQRKHSLLVMDGAGAMHAAQQSQEGGNRWGPPPKRDEFDPNIFKNNQEVYNIPKQRNNSMPSRPLGPPTFGTLNEQQADLSSPASKGGPAPEKAAGPGGDAKNGSTHVSCERFNCITKFAYATSVGHQPGNPHKQNQDSYILVPNMLNQLGLHFFSVCDGHGMHGHHVSQYLKEKLPIRFQQHLELYQGHVDTQSIHQIEQFYSKIPQYLHNSYNLLHQELANQKIFQYDTHLSGSTCCSVLFDRNTVFCANAGDSRAVLYSFSEAEGGMRVTPLSIDHKPELPLEKKRIEKLGGRVDSIKGPQGQSLGPKRVWLKNQDMPGLAMSRSIGDLLAHMVGVSTDPEVMRFELGPEHKFLVIASDGVWEFLSNEQIGKIVWPFYKINSPEQAGNAIVRAAAEKWRQNDTVIDDITCVTIFLEVDCKIPNIGSAMHQQSRPKKHPRTSASQAPAGPSKLYPDYHPHQGVPDGVKVIEASNTQAIHNQQIPNQALINPSKPSGSQNRSKLIKSYKLEPQSNLNSTQQILPSNASSAQGQGQFNLFQLNQGQHIMSMK